jgi:hypothetical protein
LISFVVGFRYEVGVDWQGYKDGFIAIKNNLYLSYTDQYWEFAYLYINKIIAELGLSSEWMFFTVAFISWYFIFKSINQKLLPLLIFFLFVDEYFFWSMNGVRQFAAMAIWLVAIKQIINKKFFKFVFFIFIASLFHKSALLLFPFYFVPYLWIEKDQQPKRLDCRHVVRSGNQALRVFHHFYGFVKDYMWIVVFFITLIIGSNSQFVNGVESIIIFFANKFEIIESYSRYVYSGKFIIHEETTIGLGFLFKLIVNFILIMMGINITKAYPKTKTYFFIFFVGVILFNLSYNIQLMGRINNYFIILRSILLSISVYHFWKVQKYRIFVIGFCSLYFVLFITAIYNSSNMCSPFEFSFWGGTGFLGY